MKTTKAATPRNQIDALDRDSFEPAYMQLVNIIRRQVASGLLLPGDQLPSESQLRQRYHVSPMTVRRAINILADQGIIDTVQGRGSFVRPLELGAAAFHLDELTDLLDDSGRTSVKLVEASIMLADERTARKLAIPTSERVIYIRRLILTDDEPTLYHRAYLIYDPTRPIVENEMEVTSLRGLFSGSGETLLKRGELTIAATILNEEEAQLLQVDLPAAGFCIKHVFYDFGERPISWGLFIVRSDRLHFETTVGLPANI